MPAFTFEKLSPPPAPVATAVPPAKKPRRLFGYMIDRFVEVRVRKTVRKERGLPPRQPK